MIGKIRETLGADESLLEHQCKTVPKENLQLPGPDFIDRVLTATDRPARTAPDRQQRRLGRPALRSGQPTGHPREPGR